MKYALALVVGLVGAALGFVLGAAVAAALAPLLGISEFEGAAGYFAVFIGGPLGAVLGFGTSTVLVLRRSGHRSLAAIAGRLALVAVGVLAVGAAALAAFWVMRPVINTNGPAPQLVFEIRLPPEAAPPNVDGYAIELQTSRNRMPGRLEGPREEDGRMVIAGSVEMYFRTWRRTLVLTTPDKTDVLFDIRLGPSPAHGATFGAWQRPDYIGEPGKDEARPATAADRYEIRYRAAWADD